MIRRPWVRLSGRLEDRSVGIRLTDVEHEPWTLHPATVPVAGNTLFEANGFGRPMDEPAYYYGPGVDVVTTRSRRWDRTDTT
ncbi:DUF2071 domain-containing protein [Halalkalicoccus ordinarius]|uniref:DUF2071 domain-containing protein n=1 Tax=Halalkalicoccus ordinarius TaxID=3116651 RepID=UPI00300E9E94